MRVSGRAVLLGIALNVILFYYLLRNLSTKLEQKKGKEKMFISNIKKLMEEKGKTFQDVVQDSGLSRQTIHKARQDEGIAECRLSTLGKIGSALGVKTKRLYEETDGKEEE